MNETALLSLELTDFRSYKHVHLPLDARPVVLYGRNGAGKTNILEAISLLVPGRGLRRVRLDVPIRREANGQGWAVHAQYRHAGAAAGDPPLPIGTGYDRTRGNRIVRIDGVTVRPLTLADHIRLVWLTPEQDRLFAGPRAPRLRFFDRLTLSLHPDHGRNANAYEKAMRNRQRLLDEGAHDATWIAGCEREMASAGARVMQARADTLAQLQYEIENHGDSGFPRADLTLAGGYEDAPSGDEADLEAALLGIIEQSRPRDCLAGRALCGPHRADLEVGWRAKAMPAARSSTGEQKALLIGLTLAHARAVAAQEGGPAPLILLDEACAHLDTERRALLIEEICALKGQAWLSGTDASLFEAFGDRAQYFEVSGGTVQSRN